MSPSGIKLTARSLGYYSAYRRVDNFSTSKESAVRLRASLVGAKCILNGENRGTLLIHFDVFCDASATCYNNNNTLTSLTSLTFLSLFFLLLSPLSSVPRALPSALKKNFFFILALAKILISLCSRLRNAHSFQACVAGGPCVARRHPPPPASRDAQCLRPTAGA